MMKKFVFSFFLMLFMLANTNGQTIQQVADINPAGSSYPWQLTLCNNKLFFIASNELGLRSLYVTEGTPATTKALTTPRGVTYSNYPVAYKNKLYFVYDDGINGQEIWVSDGTPSGTKLFVDIYPGATSSYPLALTVANDKLFFIADNQTAGKRLYVSDGTAAGTIVINNGYTGYFNGGDNGLIVYKNSVIFVGENASTFSKGLWMSDGNTVTVVKDGLSPGATGPFAAELNGKLYFCGSEDTYGNELWVTDGTNGGTKLVKDIGSGVGFSSNPQSFITYNNKVYFSADDGVHGQELWATDGTENGTTIVKDIAPGTDGSRPYANVVFNNKLYFATWALNQLWSTDGTENGTQLVATVPGALKFAANWNGNMYLISGETNSIYQSDGTAAGTIPMHVDNSASIVYRNYQAGADQYFLPYNQDLYFQASAAGITTGLELVKLSPAIVSFMWTGITSSDWNTATNWSGGVVPVATSDVIIQPGTPFSLVITATQQVACNSLHVSPNAQVTVNTGGNITVKH